jgi:hypothetical protein
MARYYVFVVAVCVVLVANISTSPTVADEPAAGELPEELLAKARELVKGWDRPAPRVEFAEKWRVSLPIREFPPVVWATESDRLAVLTSESEVLVLDANDGRELARFKGKAEDRSDAADAKGLPSAIAITPDGKHVAIGCTDGVLVWNWGEDKVAFVHGFPKKGVVEVQISGNGKQILFADRNKTFGYFPLFGGMGFASGFITPLDTHLTELAIDYDGRRVIGRSSRARPIFEAIFDDNPSPNEFPWAPAIGLEGTTSVAAGNKMRVTGDREGRLNVFEAPLNVKGVGRPSDYISAPFQHLHRVYITPDDQWAMATSSGGDVAVRHTQGKKALWVGVIPEVRIRTVQSAFGGLIATSRTPGELVRFDIKPLAAHPVREMDEWVIDAVSRKAFDEIDAVFAVLVDDPGVFPSIPGESKFATLGREMISTPVQEEVRKRFEPARDEWLETRSRRPGAAFASATRKVAAGYEARGAGYAFTITPEGAEEFHKQMMAANDVLEPFFNGDKPPPPDMYASWFAIGTGAGWSPPVMRLQIKQFVDRIDRWNPACETVATMLLPRWYGELEDAHKFATNLEEKIGGDAGKGVYARIAIHLFNFHGGDVWVQNRRQPGDNTPTLGFDFPKTKAGLIHVLEKENEHVGAPFLKQALTVAEAYYDDELTSAVVRRKERRLRGEQ